MRTTSITMAYDTITPEVLPTWVNGVLRDNNLAVLFASSERIQETQTSLWDFGSSAGTHRINYCGSSLGGERSQTAIIFYPSGTCTQWRKRN